MNPKLLPARARAVQSSTRTDRGGIRNRALHEYQHFTEKKNHIL